MEGLPSNYTWDDTAFVLQGLLSIFMVVLLRVSVIEFREMIEIPVNQGFIRVQDVPNLRGKADKLLYRKDVVDTNHQMYIDFDALVLPTEKATYPPPLF
jgi:hypothetical protein